MMEAYIPLLCLAAFATLLWASVLRRRSRERPVVWTWWGVAALALGVLGAVAVPVLVAAAIRNP